MKLIVGIDFGTSTTVVRYKMEGSDNICVIKDEDGISDIIPSAIFRPAKTDSDPAQRNLYGKKALSIHIGGGEGTLITNFKMGLVSSDPKEQEEKKTLIKEFLKYLAERFHDQTIGLHYTECDIFVSYPAKWPSSLANFMKEAVAEAGFNGKVYGVFEPIAAVQNAITNHMKHLQQTKLLSANRPLNILMLDMGAGTSDIYIFTLTLENADGSLKPTIINGTSYPSFDDPSLCGGREIDIMLQEIVNEHLKKNLPFSDEQLLSLFSAYDAKAWKDGHLSDTLKNNQSAGLPSKIITSITPLSGFLPPQAIASAKQFQINRASFEEKTKSHWAALYSMIQSAMTLHNKKYGISAADIDLVLLTGGHSSWYTIPMLFNGEGLCGQIGRDHIHDGNEVKATHFTKLEAEPWRILSDALPHESVARGLVLKPEGIPIPASSPNNVWIRFRVNDKSSEYRQVIKIGDQLPLETEEGEFTIAFKDQYKEHVFDLCIDVLTGETQETAELWTYKKHYDERGIAIIVTVLLGGLPLLTGYDYSFKLSYKFDANEDGTIHFYSELKKDSETPIKIEF